MSSEPCSTKRARGRAAEAWRDTRNIGKAPRVSVFRGGRGGLAEFLTWLRPARHHSWLAAFTHDIDRNFGGERPHHSKTTSACRAGVRVSRRRVGRRGCWPDVYSESETTVREGIRLDRAHGHAATHDRLHLEPVRVRRRQHEPVDGSARRFRSPSGAPGRLGGSERFAGRATEPGADAAEHQASATSR